jgi:hypothetical protein
MKDLKYLKQKVCKKQQSLLLKIQKNEKYVYFQQLHQVIVYGRILKRNEMNLKKRLKKKIKNKFYCHCEFLRSNPEKI